MKIKYSIAFASLVLFAAGFNSSARSATLFWNFDFVLSNTIAVTGVFETQDTPSGGPYLITAIDNGLLNGVPITLLSVDTTPPIFNDNLLFTTFPFVDGNGVGFTTPNGAQWSIWNSGWCNNGETQTDHMCTFPPDAAGTVTSYQVSQNSFTGHSAAIDDRPRRNRSARLAQEAEGAGGGVS